MTSRLGPAGVWSNFDRLPLDEVLAFARSAEEGGFDAFWTQETAGRDPFALLSSVAGATRRIRLGVGIAVIHGRDAVAMKAGAATVQEASGGRMVLGVGVSHRDTVSEVRGHPYPPPLAAMRAFLSAYRDAIYRGPMPHRAPPVVLAALRKGMLGLAAREADGAFPYLVPEAYVRRTRQLLDETAAAAGRARPLLVASLACGVEPDAARARAMAHRYLQRYLGLPNYRANLLECGFTQGDLVPPGSDRLVDALVAWGDDTAVRARLRAMLDAGADHVALIPLADDGRHADRATMEALAPPW